MKILITDLDDTLLDWTKSFDTFIRENYGYDDVFLSDNPKRLWEILGVTKDEVTAIMKKHTQIERFGNLEYYKDAALINTMKNHFDKIIALTSCGNDKEIVEKRNKNVKSLFPVIDNIIYLDFLHQKEDKLKSIIDAYPHTTFYMIDDNIIDVQSALDLGIQAWVYKSAFQHSKDLPIVETLSEFFEKIV